MAMEETCHNFYIRSSLLTPNIRHVFFEGELVGFITPDPDGGFVVEPAYIECKTGTWYGNFESACVELIFHYYAQTRTVLRH